MTTQPWAVAVGCFVAGSLAAAGIANATSAPTKIPDSNTGVITACMKKKTGKVRFINAQKGKTCTKKEKKVTFNQAGPQGEQGPAGAQGPIGPSKAYVNSTNPWIGFVVPSTGKTVASLSLPAGNYVLAGQATLLRTQGGTTGMSCEFKSAVGTLTSKPGWATVDLNESEVVSLTGTLTTDGNTGVDVVCKASGADAVALGGGVITATEVGAVAVQ
ncbi:MAG: hypothetical protein H6524_12195 [Actinobacteria bacterium]|nr:hypothetical protein [Micrococcales bacterium]MCB0905262.1 hypothetical protein [Actinomycetota bacterium]MCO5301218.1 DNA-binding protein [Candidatus Nanopelagicales bacterium]MCB9429561.1 hypothetical protein [Actinomycetota bacterium]HPE14188.1 hypothetical protein [Actinomycetota bacterium]